MSVFEPLMAPSSLPVMSAYLIALFSLSIAVMEFVVAWSAFAVSGLIGGAICWIERVFDWFLQSFADFSRAIRFRPESPLVLYTELRSGDYNLIQRAGDRGRRGWRNALLDWRSNR